MREELITELSHENAILLHCLHFKNLSMCHCCVLQEAPGSQVEEGMKPPERSQAWLSNQEL